MAAVFDMHRQDLMQMIVSAKVYFLQIPIILVKS